MTYQLNTTKKEQHLCTNCGLCCDGTLYDYAPLTQDELQSDKCTKHKISTVSYNNQASIKLACNAFNKKCTIYENRFDICRSFKCKLLLKHAADKIDFISAEHIIQSIKEEAMLLRQLFNEQTNTNPNESFSLRYYEFKEHNIEIFDTKEFRIKHNQLLLSFVTFQNHLHTIFGYSNKHNAKSHFNQFK